MPPTISSRVRLALVLPRTVGFVKTSEKMIEQCLNRLRQTKRSIIDLLDVSVCRSHSSCACRPRISNLHQQRLPSVRWTQRKAHVGTTIYQKNGYDGNPIRTSSSSSSLMRSRTPRNKSVQETGWLSASYCSIKVIHSGSHVACRMSACQTDLTEHTVAMNTAVWYKKCWGGGRKKHNESESSGDDPYELLV